MRSHRIITLRASGFYIVPGEVVVVKLRKQWSYAGHPYLSGQIVSTRLEVPALELVPLRLEDQGMWDPDEEYWGEPGEPIEEWAEPIIARGPRQAFEIEQVLPGADAADPDSDPITDANELKAAGDRRTAHPILMKLCETDLRCLDAHAHLGNFAFDYAPDEAIRHYEVGLRTASCRSARTSMACCCGATSTIGRSCAARTVTDCAAGVSIDSRRPSVSLSACSG